MWRPKSSIATLKFRAQVLAKIRAFFAERIVLEVETPLLLPSTTTDPNIASFNIGSLYLQTSPEFAMKRLLAAGSGSIYQICKAFRQGEQGRLHALEFTMLEWYRVGFDHNALMDEIDVLLDFVFAIKAAARVSYRDVFVEHLGIDPHLTSFAELKESIEKNRIQLDAKLLASLTCDDLLGILLSHCIEPHLGRGGRPTFIFDFPASQAALARVKEIDYSPSLRGLSSRRDEAIQEAYCFSGLLRKNDRKSSLEMTREVAPCDDAGLVRVAERFELYLEGVELGNGFHELCDAKEQRQRFLKDLQRRQELQLQEVPLDEKLLAALSAGLPDCAGVALGLDRLLMVVLGKKSIAEVLSFG